MDLFYFQDNQLKGKGSSYLLTLDRTLGSLSAKVYLRNLAAPSKVLDISHISKAKILNQSRRGHYCHLLPINRCIQIFRD